MREVKGSLGRIAASPRDVHSTLKSFDDRLRKVEIDIARVHGRLHPMPSAWTLFAAILATVLTVTSLTFAIVRFGVPN